MAGARNRSEVNADADSVARATITTAVSDHVRALIFDRRVLPGQRLVAEAIAEELGVSRVPVREALRQLDGSGLVEVRPRRGATVVSFDLSSNADLLALLQVRRELESWAAAEAARRHRDDDIGPIETAPASRARSRCRLLTSRPSVERTTIWCRRWLGRPTTAICSMP